MKRAEIVLGIFSLIGLVFIFNHWSGGGPIFTLSMLCLSVLYMFFSFILLNGVRLRSVFRKDGYTGINAAMIIASVITGWCLSVQVSAVMFAANDWPGAAPMLFSAVLSFFPVFLGVFIWYMNDKNVFTRRATTRLALLGALCMLLYFTRDT